uniref:Gamma-tubulin complex component n=1 Tax=Amblyomma sculptum TaxID=1581419 RepID=A0A1E1XL62_AMBSC
MLHELLFALNGYPGTIFVEKEGTFSVVKGLPFLHPSETTILDRLCALGYHVKYLRSFVSTYHSLSTAGSQEGEKTLKTGFYLHALCAGLKKVLHQYSEELLNLEKEVLEGNKVSLMRFQEVLDKYHLLFLKLRDLVAEVESNRVHGCSILQCMHKSSITALPLAKKSMSLLLQAGYGVLCQQISSWVLHGLLCDPHKEFFVKKLSSSPSQTPHNSSSSTLEAPLESMDDFGLDPHLLPEQLSASFAKKVLFAGAAVRVFGQSMGRPVYKAEQETEFLDRLQTIKESPELDLLHLEAFVEDVRSAAAAHLWQLFVEEGCLLSQLRLLRDAYLLGRGELFLHFSQKAEHLLCRPRAATTEHEVNEIFQQACSLLQSEDENLAEQFRITVGPPLLTQDSTQPPLAGWETIGLNYKVTWPLHVFFTPATLSKYSRLFRLLFGVQRAQAFLQECWLLQCKVARTGPLQDCPLMRRMMQLRSEMAHLLDSLQYYLQVDVIESQLGRLLSRVKETRDFEAIQHVHNSYLASLLTDSMLMLQPVHECFRAILGMSQSFHAIFPTSKAPLTQRQFSQFETIEKDFQCQKQLLLKVLSSLHNKLSEAQPSQLLLRLDSGYRSACAADSA